MKVNFKFVSSLLLVMIITGCASQGNKTNDEANAPTPEASALKDFERVVPPPLLRDMQEQAGFLVTNFWNKFDFTDTMYCHAPEITEQAFVDFLSFFPHATTEKISEGVKKLLDAAEVDVVMYNYFYKKGEHYLYDPNSPMRSDEFFIPFLEHVVASDRVLEDNKVIPKLMLELAYRNRIGTKATNFTYTLNSGQTGNLYGVSAKYTLLMFYNPDCRECHIARSQIMSSPVITAAVSSGTLKVLAVYPDENLEVWRSHLDEIPSSWINGYDRSLTVRNDQIYDLKAIPTLYLLDRDKTVLLKDAATGIIHQYLENNP